MIKGGGGVLVTKSLSHPKILMILQYCNNCLNEHLKKKTKLSQYKLITVYFSPTLICRSWTWGNTWDRCLVEIWGTPLFLCTHPSTSGSSEGCWIKPQKGKASTTEPLNYDKTPMFVWLYIFSCKPLKCDRFRKPDVTKWHLS